MKNHYSIKPINAYVMDDILYGKNQVNELIPCKIISLCLYLNESLCFDIILEDGSIFNYIPLHKIVHNKNYDKNINLIDLVYHNCNDLVISINEIEYLKSISNINVFLKNKNEWVSGEEYLFSIDWYNANDLLNLIKLSNGYFCLIPNHKIIFGKNKEFKKYKKIPSIFKV